MIESVADVRRNLKATLAALVTLLLLAAVAVSIVAGASLGMATIWTIFLLACALSATVLVVASRRPIEVAERHERNRVDAENRLERVEAILESINHQMGSAIVSVGFEVDDLTDEGVETEALSDAFGQLELGREVAVALASLGSNEFTGRAQTVSADQLRVDKGDLEVVGRRGEVLVEVDRALLRALVALVAQSSAHFATELVVQITGRRLVLSDNGSRDGTNTLQKVWASDRSVSEGPGRGFKMVRRIAQAHGAEAHFNANAHGGMRLVVEFPPTVDSAPPLLDLDRPLPAPTLPLIKRAQH